MDKPIPISNALDKLYQIKLALNVNLEEPNPSSSALFSPRRRFIQNYFKGKMNETLRTVFDCRSENVKKIRTFYRENRFYKDTSKTRMKGSDNKIHCQDPVETLKMAEVNTENLLCKFLINNNCDFKKWPQGKCDENEVENNANDSCNNYVHVENEDLRTFEVNSEFTDKSPVALDTSNEVNDCISSKPVEDEMDSLTDDLSAVTIDHEGKNMPESDDPEVFDKSLQDLDVANQYNQIKSDEVNSQNKMFHFLQQLKRDPQTWAQNNSSDNSIPSGESSEVVTDDLSTVTIDQEDRNMPESDDLEVFDKTPQESDVANEHNEIKSDKVNSQNKMFHFFQKMKAQNNSSDTGMPSEESSEVAYKEDIENRENIDPNITQNPKSSSMDEGEVATNNRLQRLLSSKNSNVNFWPITNKKEDKLEVFRVENRDGATKPKKGVTFAEVLEEVTTFHSSDVIGKK